MSVAPEIARLAEPILLLPPQHPQHPQPGQQTAPIARPTLGTLARRLRIIAATPERWWSLVRFEPGQAVEIGIEAPPGYRVWLMVLPPGHQGQPCDCDAATMIAGEAVERPERPERPHRPHRPDDTDAGPLLRPGSLRVHGQRHRLHGRGTGYSISLHARALPAQPSST
jgi:hypothetical protein